MHDNDSNNLDGAFNGSQEQNWPKYWVMVGTDSKNPLSKINPFLLLKGIQGISPSLKVKRLRNGSLLLECEHLRQAKTLKKTTQLGQVPVKASPHKTMNSCQGIIRCREISDMSDDDIKQELASQGVSRVKQFTRKTDGHVKKTSTFLLTFNSTTLPKSINVGYLKVKVEVFVPNPLRCYGCQRYGHGQNSCKGQKVCFRCGMQDHGDDPCTGPLHCVNCAGSHSSNSKQCPMWTKECAIQKRKVHDNLSYIEAKKLVEAETPPVPSRGTYAGVVTKKVSIATQTDISCFPLSPKSASKPTHDGEKSSPAAHAAKHSSREKPVQSGSSPPLASKAGTQTSGPTSPGKKKKDAGSAKPVTAPNGKEQSKVRINRGSGRPQKGSSDPIKDGMAIYEEEDAPLPPRKGGPKNKNNKSKT